MLSEYMIQQARRIGEATAKVEGLKSKNAALAKRVEALEGLALEAATELRSTDSLDSIIERRGMRHWLAERLDKALAPSDGDGQEVPDA